jgi:lipoprotein-releasing system permease protein
LNYELFIAKRIAFSGDKNNTVSRPIIRIALIGIALGFAVMMIALAVVSGFKKQIREKVIGFGSHIQISNFDQNNSYETVPISKDQPFVDSLRKMKGIRHIQVFATKAGIIKVNLDNEGIVAKGIGSDFDWTYFKSYIKKGKTFSVTDGQRSDSILISQNLANKLRLNVGDKAIIYFIQQPPRVRRFYVSGIYETGLEQFDDLYLFCDIGQIQKLNDWTNDQVGGFEITVSNFDELDPIASRVYNSIGPNLNSRTIIDLFPQIFDWLNLQNINAIVIITLLILVSGINMISALLVIILERVNMIGIMKAIGAESISIRKIFIYLSGYLIGKGILWGNIIGLAFIFFQSKYGLIPLDQKNYYLSYVPVNFSFLYWLLLNAGTMTVCIVMMILPTMIVTKIRPLAAIRYS